MQLLITRETSTDVTTPGQLFLVNGNTRKWLAYTLEDVVRHDGKIHGRTAIPAGSYGLRGDIMAAPAVPAYPSGANSICGNPL